MMEEEKEAKRKKKKRRKMGREKMETSRAHYSSA